jgi:hypothetical protein
VGLTTLPPSCDDCLEMWKLLPPVGLYSECILGFLTNSMLVYVCVCVCVCVCVFSAFIILA